MTITLPPTYQLQCSWEAHVGNCKHKIWVRQGILGFDNKMGYQRPFLYYTDENSCKNIICYTEYSFFIPTHSQDLLIQTNRGHSQASLKEEVKVEKLK